MDGDPGDPEAVGNCHHDDGVLVDPYLVPSDETGEVEAPQTDSSLKGVPSLPGPDHPLPMSSAPGPGMSRGEILARMAKVRRGSLRFREGCFCVTR